MALEYGFDLGGPVEVDEVAALFDRTLSSALLVVVRSATRLPFPDPVEEEYGFAPSVHVLFRLDTFADLAAQRRETVELVAAALTAFSCDALLRFNGEVVWLVRTGGRLTVSDRDDLWRPELLALLPAHERAPLPNR